jgi:N-acylneuraminate cytidylyltransferase
MVLDGVRPRARWPEAMAARSQDLVEHVHDAGLFYWFDTAKFLAGGALIGSDAVAFVVPATRTQDLNTPEDWLRAEQKLQLLGSGR